MTAPIYCFTAARWRGLEQVGSGPADEGRLRSRQDHSARIVSRELDCQAALAGAVQNIGDREPVFAKDSAGLSGLTVGPVEKSNLHATGRISHSSHIPAITRL
jgi:hypothetical protein